MAIHELAALLYRDQLPGSWVPGYLAGRGFPAYVQRRWQVGYAASGPDALLRHLRAAGYPDVLIETAGLARRTRHGQLVDMFRDRAVLPIRSHGRIVAFVGRAAEHADPGVPKYLNSPTTPLYTKGDVLFGLCEAQAALAAGATPVLTEGPLDAIAVALANPDCAPVSPCGTALTARQTHLLGAGHAEIVVAFDADRSGQLASLSAYHLLAPACERVTAVVFPAGSDPARVLSDHGPGMLAAMLEHRRRPLADLVVDAEFDRWDGRLSFAEGQIGALRAAARLVGAMPASDVGRQVGRVADRLGLDHAIVTEAVTDAVTRLVLAGAAGLGFRM